MSRKIIKPVDITIIALAVITAAISLFCFVGKDSDSILISQGGERIATMPLNKDDSLTFGALTVTVKDGVAFVSSSDCKDKICMRSELKKSGDCAICLPNKLSITVSGEPEADAVTY